MANFRFTVVIENDSDGYYAYCPELQGCYAQGGTYEETLKNINPQNIQESRRQKNNRAVPFTLLHPKILRSIITDAGITEEELSA